MRICSLPQPPLSTISKNNLGYIYSKVQLWLITYGRKITIKDILCQPMNSKW